MPPRPAKKSPAKKPSPKANKQEPASISSPVEALPSIAEEQAPLVDAASDDFSAENEAPSSPALVDVEKEVKDEEKIAEPDEPVSNNPVEYEEFSEGKESESNAKEDQSESGESLEDQGTDENEEAGVVVTGVEVGEDKTEGIDTKDDLTIDAGEDNEDIEDEDHLLSIQAALAESGKQKELEIFVGGLDKETVEEDLIAVFGAYGEVQTARIVRHPTTKKSKGFAFIHYVNNEHATKALADLKDGTEIKGKLVRIQACQGNTTLYLGNICKTWTKENVVEKLNSLGIEQFDNILLPNDTKNEDKIKGFAFLDFSSHSDAMQAFQRLRKPDADFGRERTAKVAFASSSLPPNEDDQLQVKTVYVEGIPLSWDEDKIKEICKEYGQIEKIRLSRNINSTKRKDFGFVEFSSRESALNCVEGINKAQIGDGDAKVTANLAKPVNKSRLAKQSPKGGFKTKKDGETIQETGGIGKKRKPKFEGKRNVPKYSKRRKSSIYQIKDSKSKTDSHTPSIKRKQGIENDMDADTTHHPSKKTRQNHNNGKAHGRQFGNLKNTHSTTPKSRYGSRTSYRGSVYAEASEPQLHPSDLVPHAGYLPPLKQVANNYGYDRRRTGTYSYEPSSSFGSGRGMPPSYYSQSAYYNYQTVGHRHPSSGSYAPRGPYY